MHQYRDLLRRAGQRRPQRHSPPRRESPRQNQHSPGHATHWEAKPQITGYDPVKRLHEGGLSESVKIMRHRSTGVYRVLKRVNARARPREELEILKRIPKHCHLNYMVCTALSERHKEGRALLTLMQVEYAWISSTEVQFALEYCDLGDLGQLLQNHIMRGQKTPESLLWNVLGDIGKALAFLHSGIKDPMVESKSRPGWDTICHLDIKPPNIFVKRGERPGDRPIFVLGDFGCAITWSDVRSHKESSQAHRHGTKDWFPPHSISQVVGEKNLAYGWHTDIWQLGAVVSTLSQLRARPHQSNLFAERTSPVGSGYSRALHDVVRQCVRSDRTKRPRAADLVRTVLRRRR